MSAGTVQDGRGGADGAAPPVVLEVDLGPGVRAGFTTRDGGLSPAPWDTLNLGLNVTDDADRVRANRARAAAWLGVPASFATQVHGTRVATVEPVPRGADPV
ncbi:laccase domain-containing protein, partial [Cellulosimicrobium cellulans]|uniref:laccase domain-containing protein n=1 Tax=Cellulosimicrobium cellulans TaxID=1710 RepID=UPI0029E7FBA0